MKKIINLLFLLTFIPIVVAQTFTLNELENYSKYDFETFSNKVMTKGYEFFSAENDLIVFRYTASSVSNFYLMTFTDFGISYTTTYKVSYTNLVNSIKGKGYEYVKSTTENQDQVCSYFENNDNVILTCMASLESDYYEKPPMPFYEVRVFPKIFESND